MRPLNTYVQHALEVLAGPSSERRTLPDITTTPAQISRQGAPPPASSPLVHARFAAAASTVALPAAIVVASEALAWFAARSTRRPRMRALAPWLRAGGFAIAGGASGWNASHAAAARYRERFLTERLR